jgi:hypothetical protein
MAYISLHFLSYILCPETTRTKLMHIVQRDQEVKNTPKLRDVREINQEYSFSTLTNSNSRKISSQINRKKKMDD